MTETLQSLERRISSADELYSITRTMRGLAAVNLRHYELAAQALTTYEAIVEDGLHVVLRDGALSRLPVDRPPETAPTAMIVFGSNQGLCGPINRHVASHASTLADEIPTLTYVAAVGLRMEAELGIAGLSTSVSWDLPGTIEAVPARAEQVLTQAERWRTDDVGRLMIVFPHFLGRSRGYEPVALQLLPTDRDWLEWLAIRRWPSRTLPTYTLPWDGLVADLIRQALFARLHQGFAQTMAAVAGSRLAAMTAAQHSIEERLVELQRQHNHMRHTEISNELLDVISGFESIQDQ